MVKFYANRDERNAARSLANLDSVDGWASVNTLADVLDIIEDAAIVHAVNAIAFAAVITGAVKRADSAARLDSALRTL